MKMSDRTFVLELLLPAGLFLAFFVAYPLFLTAWRQLLRADAFCAG